MGKKFTYQEVKEFIEGKEGNGCKLLSTEYVDACTRLQIRCACGEIFEKSFGNFRKKQRQCNKCSGITKWSFDMVKEFIEGEEGNGCKLLSTEFKSCKTKLQIRCACGEIFEASFDKFRSRDKRQCNKCGDNIIKGKQKTPYQEVKEFIEGEEGNGCKLLSTEYVNNSTKLKIRCACGEIFEKSFQNFKQRNQRRCPKCGLLLNIGENNHRYNPNLTNEERELKRCIPNYKDFTEQVYERDDYTCQCCGKKGGRLNVHHVNSYNWDKKHRTDANNGITLCKDCHKEFHSVYGYGNNTIEQFREFLYNKYLETNDLKYLKTLEDIDIRATLINNLSLVS